MSNGTPEYYLTVSKESGIDEDAISCILHRMSAINYLLWAIERLIKQAQILLSGSEVES